MLHGICTFSQSGALDFQNILGEHCLLHTVAALCVEISPHERLRTRAQHSIKMLSSLEQAWVPHVQGVEKVSDHRTTNLDKRRNSEGKL